MAAYELGDTERLPPSGYCRKPFELHAKVDASPRLRVAHRREFLSHKDSGLVYGTKERRPLSQTPVEDYDLRG